MTDISVSSCALADLCTLFILTNTFLKGGAVLDMDVVSFQERSSQNSKVPLSTIAIFSGQMMLRTYIAMCEVWDHA
jgi:hypothetical protein